MTSGKAIILMKFDEIRRRARSYDCSTRETGCRAGSTGVRARAPRHRPQGRRLDRDGRSRAQSAAGRSRGNGAARGRGRRRARLSAARRPVRGVAAEADAACRFCCRPEPTAICGCSASTSRRRTISSCDLQRHEPLSFRRGLQSGGAGAQPAPSCAARGRHRLHGAGSSGSCAKPSRKSSRRGTRC